MSCQLITAIIRIDGEIKAVEKDLEFKDSPTVRIFFVEKFIPHAERLATSIGGTFRLMFPEQGSGVKKIHVFDKDGELAHEVTVEFHGQIEVPPDILAN